jgi:hypothetical protein
MAASAMRLQRSSPRVSATEIHDDLERALDEAITANDRQRATGDHHAPTWRDRLHHVLAWFTSRF